MEGGRDKEYNVMSSSFEESQEKRRYLNDPKPKSKETDKDTHPLGQQPHCTLNIIWYLQCILSTNNSNSRTNAHTGAYFWC
jgi:hypothetical protein